MVLLLLLGAAACAGPDERADDAWPPPSTRRLVRELPAGEPHGPSPPVYPQPPSKEQPPPHEYVAPYHTIELMSGHWDCRGGRRHAAYDLLGDGENAGLGTPIVSIGTSRIRSIGRPSQDPRSFGRPLRRRGTTVRGGRRLPASEVIEGYGRVYFFTRSPGSWRTGAILVAELLEGPLAGYTVRYLHLGAVRPSLSEGDLLKPGTEIGLLGGTAVQDSTPHLHIDLADPFENRIDLAPILGIEARSKEAIPEC